MRTIIAGNRNFLNDSLLQNICDKFNEKYGITEVVCGCAKGADTLGEEWAKRKGIPVKRFPANWDRYGKAAGMIRNTEMAEYADENGDGALILFNFGNGKGSADMLDKAERLGMCVWDAKDIVMK